MGITPIQSAEGTAGEGDPRQIGLLDSSLIDELWHAGEAASCGLERDEFKQILLAVGNAQSYGLEKGTQATRAQQGAFFKALKLNDLVLARSCAMGKEAAWERFLRNFRQPVIRAAIAITGSETLGRDLADQLYAELYGLKTRDGERRCPLDSYRGRGSLMGWLRTTLAQRHVDHHRRSHREEPLEGFDTAAPEANTEAVPAELTLLENAVEAALTACEADDRLLLAAYYLDGRTLLQIAQVVKVHEATVSRRLKRVCEEVRKEVLKNLQSMGMSMRAAEEELGADPRDLDMNLKKLLQQSQTGTFIEKAEQ